MGCQEPLYNRISLNLKNKTNQYVLNRDVPIPATMGTVGVVGLMEALGVVVFTIVGEYDVFVATDLVLVVVFVVTSVYQRKSLF